MFRAPFSGYLGPRADRVPLGALARSGNLVLGAYLAAFAAAALGAVLLGGNPFVTKSWLGTQGVVAAVLSAGIGTMLGAATVALTRVMVRRAAWARALHADLRPVVRGASDRALVAMAVASSLGEEVIFRGLLVPFAGIAVSSVLFGLLHQVRGRARWGWMLWAGVMGLLFAVLFKLTGSLVGPLLAHAYVNAYNLRFLRDNDPSPKRPRAMGGLLAPR